MSNKPIVALLTDRLIARLKAILSESGVWKDAIPGSRGVRQSWTGTKPSGGGNVESTTSQKRMHA